MKKVLIHQKKECETKIKKKTQEQRLSKKYLNCEAKCCPGIKLICFCKA